MACGLQLFGQFKVKVVIDKLTRYFLCDVKDVILRKMVCHIYLKKNALLKFVDYKNMNCVIVNNLL